MELWARNMDDDKQVQHTQGEIVHQECFCFQRKSGIHWEVQAPVFLQQHKTLRCSDRLIHRCRAPACQAPRSWLAEQRIFQWILILKRMNRLNLSHTCSNKGRFLHRKETLLPEKIMNLAMPSISWTGVKLIQGGWLMIKRFLSYFHLFERVQNLSSASSQYSFHEN